MDKAICRISSSAEEHKMKKRSYNVDDRVTINLPDDILVTILCASSMKDAARLSVLSRQWKMWWSCYPRLIFDGTEILRELCKQKAFYLLYLVELHKFVGWVNQVVKSHHGPTIEEFRVRFYLTNHEAAHIDTWVNFALGKNVKMLELAFKLAPHLTPAIHLYIFPPNRPNAKAHLGYSSLMVLRLVGVDITEKALEFMLSNYRSLETLHVVCSHLPANLKVVGEPLKLKYLEVDSCMSVKNIEISAMHLVSLKFKGPKISMSLKNVPQLQSLTIEDHFFRHAPQISRCLHSTRLQHLKYLELSIIFCKGENLLGFVYLIQACPILYSFRLELEMRASEGLDPKEVPYASKPQWGKRSKKYLKIIEFAGFLGDAAIDLELATYVIESSWMPEKVIFDTRDLYLDDEDCKKRETSRKCAAQLGKKLPQGTNVVII